jgi:glycosyltransferase involved in cell wall biosynthesis
MHSENSMSDSAAYPCISVVIPSLGRDERLKEALRDLQRQDYPHWECIIVLQGDLGAETAGTFHQVMGKRLRVFHAGEPNASLARNIGIREAEGEIVLFLDDDVEIANPGFLSAHSRHYRDPNVAGVAGQVLGPGVSPRQKRHWISRYESIGWLFFPPTYDFPARVASAPSSNLSVRRSFAIAAGGMDAQYEKGAHREESDFGLRLAKRYGLFQFDPDASLVHIGEPVGGCRTWGHNSGVHPLHHICGEWYFILRGLQLRTVPRIDLPFHLYALLRRQILNSVNMRSLSAIVRASRQSFEGYKLARRKLAAGPRLLDTLLPSTYVELKPVTAATVAPAEQCAPGK